MDAANFVGSPTGLLVPISGNDPRYGAWQHVAFAAHPLPSCTPDLQVETFNAVADARAALAALDSSARQMSNPDLLGTPTLRREAQSTSALEGTYAPLEAVLAADAAKEQDDVAMREIINYVRMARHAYDWRRDGRPLTLTVLTELHSMLVRGTDADNDQAGRIRSIQVVIGGHRGGRIQDARFVPHPPGQDLDLRVQELIDWTRHVGELAIDPVVAAGMAHYQLEVLHPFNDGNGRIGRLLIVLHFLYGELLAAPVLTVSPWFEARRAAYYEALMGVSTEGNWDRWLRFFAEGIAAAARETDTQLRDLQGMQEELKARIRQAGIRAESAIRIVDFSIERPFFSFGDVASHLGVTYTRANQLVSQLESIGVVSQAEPDRYPREFCAPLLLAIVLRGT